MEDLIYYRYGYCLEEEPYQGPSPAFAESHNPFERWVNLCHAVGGQGLSSSVTNHAPIANFLVALLCSERPFQEVPGKYWDLSPESREPLKLFSHIHSVSMSRNSKAVVPCVFYEVHPAFRQPQIGTLLLNR